jgi:hypothetical protein
MAYGSTSWRERVVPIAIFVTDFSILPVHDDFTVPVRDMFSGQPCLSKEIRLDFAIEVASFTCSTSFAPQFNLKCSRTYSWTSHW